MRANTKSARLHKMTTYVVVANTTGRLFRNMGQKELEDSHRIETMVSQRTGLGNEYGIENNSPRDYNVPNMKISTLKRFLARPHIETELKLHRADCLGSHGDLMIYDFLLQKQKELGEEEIKPPPLITGVDVLELGIKPGPKVGELLETIKEEQLEGKLKTRAQALKCLKKLAKKN